MTKLMKFLFGANAVMNLILFIQVAFFGVELTRLTQAIDLFLLFFFFGILSLAKVSKEDK